MWDKLLQLLSLTQLSHPTASDPTANQRISVHSLSDQLPSIWSSNCLDQNGSHHQLPAPNHAVPTGPGEAPEPPWRGSRSAPPAVTPLVLTLPLHIENRQPIIDRWGTMLGR
jgi:hypothetical protein